MLRRRNENDEVARCSFCNKSQDQVDKLFGNPAARPIRVYICDECIAVCNTILDEYKNEKPTEHPTQPAKL